MCFKEECLTIKLENGTFEQDFLKGMYYVIPIYLNEICIGSIEGYSCEEFIHIEFIEINEKYRGNGYGYKVLEILKNKAKELNIKFIDGECTNRLLKFYARLGAKFEHRKEKEIDYDGLLNKFYIDL